MNNSNITKVLIHSNYNSILSQTKDIRKEYCVDLCFFNDKLNMLEQIKSGDVDILVTGLNIPETLGLSMIELAKDACPEIEIILIAETLDQVHSINMITKYNIHGFHIRTNPENNLLIQILSARKVCLQKKNKYKIY